MPIIDIDQLKSRFESGDNPGRLDYLNLIDTLASMPEAGESGLPGPQGIQGIQGEKGDTGDQGPVGPQGPAGIQGEQGSQGQAGASITLKGSVATTLLLPATENQIGDSYIVDADGNLWVWTGTIWHDAGQIVGPEGPQGVAGPQGIQGERGPAGPQGETGPAGADGSGGAAATYSTSLPSGGVDGDVWFVYS